MFFAKDNLTNTNLPKRQFGEMDLTKSKIQIIFEAKSTIQRNISIQFQIFGLIVLLVKFISLNCTFRQICKASNLNSSNRPSSNRLSSKSPEIFLVYHLEVFHKSSIFHILLKASAFATFHL